MFQQMRDGPHAAGGERLSEEAERAVGRLEEMSIDLRACAIVGDDGEALAVSAPGDWAAQAKALWSATEAADRPRATQIHVATEAGEVFAVRDGSTSAVAVAERFALASLMFCDLRAALRELGGPAGGGEG